METILERKLSAKDRRELNDSDFGLPESRSFPLNDEEHVRSAIRFFKHAKVSERKELARNINRKIKEYGMKVKVGEDNPFYKYADKSILLESHGDEIVELERTTKKLEEKIFSSSEFVPKSKPSNCRWLFEESDPNIRNKIEAIDSVHIGDDTALFKEVQLQMNSLDLIRLCGASKYIDYVMKGEQVYFGIKHMTECNKVYLLYTNRKYCAEKQPITNIYYMVELTDNVIRHIVNGFPLGHCERIKLKFISNNYDVNNTLIESFQINSNGDIKIVIDPSKSYMDEYSETHRLLVENYKNKNYEAMKTNLAYIFALISMIERDKRYKKREHEIVKARAFLINDFKTYLRHVQNHDPKFDFIEYYRTKEYDKKIINIPKESIIGLKKLFRIIFAS